MFITIPKMSSMIRQSLLTIAANARQEKLITDEVYQTVCDPDANREKYFIIRMLNAIKESIGQDREQLQLFIDVVLKPFGGFLDKIVGSMEGNSCYCNT